MNTEESKGFTARKLNDNWFCLEEYNFIFHSQSLQILGVLLDIDSQYNLRQLTSTEQLIAESFGLNVKN